MRTVHVVVHPESTHHHERIVGGWHDSDLTTKGRADALLIVGALHSAVPDGSSVGVHTSDLLRAKAVAAEASAVFGVPMHLDPGLREKSYGVAEGRPQRWLDERFVPPPATGDRMGHHEGVEGAETKREFASRIYAAIDRALIETVEHTVIVTHGFALTFVVAAWCRLPAESLGYLNLSSSAGSITTLREDDYFHNRGIVDLNSVAHLG